MADREFDLVVFDGDDTVMADDVIGALARQAGVADRVDAIHDRVWTGDLEPYEALRDRIFPLFEGMPAEVVATVVEDRPFSPGARSIARRVTCDTAVFTSIDPHARRIAKAIDADHYRANTPIMDDGILTGQLRGRIVDEGKGPTLEELQSTVGTDPDRTIVIGDGPQDIPMFERAGFSIGVQPKPAARQHVDVVVESRDFSLIEPYLRDRGVLRSTDH